MLEPSNSGDSNLVILKILSKENKKDVPPFFQARTKNPETQKYEVDETKYSRVSGTITGIKFADEEYEGVPFKVVKLYLRDQDNLYLLDLRYNMLTRSLFNSLLSVSNIEEQVKIILYQNKKGFAGVLIEQNGERVEWGYGLDDIPKPYEIKHEKTGEVVKRDYSDVDDFFESALKAWANKHQIKESTGSDKRGEGNSEPVAQAKETAGTKKGSLESTTDAPSEVEDDEDIPF